MAIPSSQSMSSEIDELYRIFMPTDLFKAIIEGNKDVLIPRLGLQPDEPTDHVQVTIEEASESALEQNQVTIEEASEYALGEISTANLTVETELQLLPVTIEDPHSGDTKNLRTVQAELRSVACFGDTVLHLLVNRRHNELALMVFKRDTSLLKLNNKMSETPLHYAAKAGNIEVIKKLIQNNLNIVKDALEEINVNGDTALHIATKQGHIDCVLEFLKLNKELLDTVNNQKLSPIHIAITKGYTDMVIHFMENYPDHAELLDDRVRNIFHIAAEENQKIIFSEIFTMSFKNKERVGRMNNAVDYDGNTPMHIAAMKGHTSIVRAIWENKTSRIAETVKNNEGLTPFEVSRRQLGGLSEYSDGAKICKYLRTEGHKFTAKWFEDVAGPPIADYWQKIQVIGLGSVLITTVTFAAAFTIPGGYNQDNGTPILGRKHIFRAFIIANSLAFIQGFLNLFALLGNAMEGPTRSALAFAIYEFILAASSMVVAFGLGMYVTLAPVSLPLAIIILVITLLLASPALFYVVSIGQKWIQLVYNIGEYIMPKSRIGIMYVLSIGTILCLAYLL